MQHKRIAEILTRVAQRRVELGLSQEELEERLILGHGWIELVEGGGVEPPLSMLLAVLGELEMSLTDLVSDFADAEPLALLNRPLRGHPTKTGVRFEFQYGQHDAYIEVPGATVGDYDKALKVMRRAFDSARPRAASDAIVQTFLQLVSAWPKANPSDIWYFLLPRAFGDPFNHPASEYGKSWEQSWKRTSGWALENVFITHYSKHLAAHSIRMEAPGKKRKTSLLGGLGLGSQVNPDKADILLVGVDDDGSERCFGVVHVARLAPLVEWVRKLTGNSSIRFYASEYQLDQEGAQAMTDGHDKIVVRLRTNEMTVLHEVAHVRLRSAEGSRGHTPEFARLLRDLYATHISQKAADVFWGIVGEYVSEA